MAFEDSFIQYNKVLSAQKEVRDLIASKGRPLEDLCLVLQNILLHADVRNLSAAGEAIAQHLDSVQHLTKVLPIPSGEFYKYRDIFRTTVSQLVTLFCLSKILCSVTSPTVYSLEEMQAVFGGVSTSDKCFVEFRLDLEEYLYGLASLPNELASLSIRCVIGSQFVFPTHALLFVQDLYASMRLLNLKNDGLRRKFDSIKYDLNKLTDLVCELKLRGLLS